MSFLPTSAPLLAFVAALLLCLAAWPASGQVQVTSWSQVSIVSMSSPNCTQSGSAVINCLLPTSLTIVTTGWGTLPLQGAFITVTGTDGSTLGPFNGAGNTGVSTASTDGGANNTLVATVFPQQYTPTLMATAAGATAPLLSVNISSWNRGATSAYPLISFVYDPPPTLTGISGCTGSGTSTTGCDPATAVLTVTGTGFRWFNNPFSSVDMWINGESSTSITQGQGFRSPPALSVQSDSQMTVNLGAAYVYLLLPVHYGGALVSIYFNERQTQNGVTTNTVTNSLSLSFIPQPSPSITSVTVFPQWSGFGCQGVNGTGPYTNCVPGLSSININGAYIYDCVIAVGGVNLTCIDLSSSSVRCQLPMLPTTVPYDLVISDPNAQTPNVFTDSGLISFRSGPSLAAVQTCVNTGAQQWNGFWTGGMCSGGATITITGTNFVTGTVTLMSNYTTFGPGFNQTTTTVSACTSATAISATTITCVLTDLTTLPGYAWNSTWFNMFGSQVGLQATFSDGSVSNSLPVYLYNFPNAPVVTNVQGCGVGPALYAYNCQPGATIILTGTNLWNNRTTYNQFTSPFGAVPTSQQGAVSTWWNPVTWGCTPLGQPNPNRVRCQLPSFTAQVAPVAPNTLYSMNAWTDIPGAGFNAAFSNQFWVSFNLGTSVTNWSQVTITSLTSSQCTIAGNAVTNCVFPATVTIVTTGYGSLSLGGNGGGVTLIAQAADGTEISATATRSAVDYGQNMYLTATFVPSIYRPTLVASTATSTAPMLNVFLRGNNAATSQTGTASLISFAYDAGPTLTSISGCTGSGAQTTSCDPATAVLTFSGSGFRWYSGGGQGNNNNGVVQLWLGNSYTALTGPGTQGGASLAVIDDSTMTVNLTLAYTYLLLPVHYGGGLVSIMLNERYWTTNTYTNQLAVSFIQQPAPVITNVATSGGGCQGTNGTGPFVNCVPQVASVDLFGQYMYDVSVTVGGVACLALTPITSSQVRCLLPYVGGAGPYDLVVSDPNAYTNAIFTEQGLISYTAGPSVAGMTTCTNTGQVNQRGTWWGGLCSEGQVVTISGNNFVTGDATAAVTFTYRQGGWPGAWPAYLPTGSMQVSCGSVVVQSSTSIQCTLPYLSSVANASYVFYGAGVNVQASFASGATTTNNLYIQVYAYPNAPIVTSVSGCSQSNSALSVSGCASTSTLTITGTNLYNTSSPGQWGSYIIPVTTGNTFAGWGCAVMSATATQLVCQMPQFDAYVSPVQQGVTYNLTVNALNTVAGNYVSGNAFAVDFTPGSGSSSSGLSSGKIAAIAVLVPIGSIVLAVLLFVCCRRNGGGFKMPSVKRLSLSKNTAFGKQVDEPTASDDTAVEMESNA